MKEATINVRGKTTTIKYQVINRIGLLYAVVLWESGETTHFYQGLYGDKTKWETKGMPDDLILAVSGIFNSTDPVSFTEADINLGYDKK